MKPIPYKEDMTIVAPCVIKDMPIEVYHQETPGISSSQLVDAIWSPALYYGRYISHEFPPLSSSGFSFGKALDTLLTTPERFDELFVVKPADMKLSTKEGKAWNAEQEGKTIISAADKKIVDILLKKLKKKKVAKQVFGSNDTQLSYFWFQPVEYGDKIKKMLCKCRPDRLSKNFISDDKSALNASYSDFQKTIGNLNYHIKAAMYQTGINMVDGTDRDFIFNVYGKKPPYPIKFYPLKEYELEVGKEYFLRGLETILLCEDSNIWPDEVTNLDWSVYLETGEWYDFTDCVEEIERPEWMQNRD